MVSPVDRMIGDFIEAGADIITFHPEASDHIDRSLQLIKAGGAKAGLVFNPATPLHYLDYVLDKVDQILLMSVNPGFGGQKFIPMTLEKLRQARQIIDASGRDIRLEVDGGVGPPIFVKLRKRVQICLWQDQRFLENQIIKRSLMKCVLN
jgi:ribulose-phosphate 3-epimerase